LRISIVTQLVVLAIFALTLHFSGLSIMLLMLLAFVLYSHDDNDHFFRLINRLRFFYLVMLLVYLFSTPGEHIVNLAYGIKPTYEGLNLGVMQLLRVTLMLAALSLLLSKSTTQQLISGLYCLLSPLTRLGFDVKRFAARLWLTLHYVEMQQAQPKRQLTAIKGLGGMLSDAFRSDDSPEIDITLERMVLSWVDYVVIFLMIVVLLLAYMYRGT